MKHQTKPKIWLLTGEKQIGKTTFLRKWVAARNEVIGLLSPVVEGRRFFYNIKTKKYVKMEIEDNNLPSEVLHVGRFQFSLLVFEQATNQLMQEIEHNATAKYLVIDEIGILEIEQKKGFYNLLIYLLTNSLHFDIVLVVRNSLLTALQMLIQNHGRESQVFSIDNPQKFLLSE